MYWHSFIFCLSSQAMLVIKNSLANAGDIKDVGLIPGMGRFPGEGNGNPTPVFLPGKLHGQRGLWGYSPWGRRVEHD